MSTGYYIEEYDRPTVTIWHRINRLLWILLVLALMGIVIGAFMPELQKQRNERDERDKLHRAIEDQKALFSRYKRQIGWLEHDPEYLGFIARDKLDVMKEGETILRVEPVKAAPLEPQRVEPQVKPKLLH